MALFVVAVSGLRAQNGGRVVTGEVRDSLTNEAEAYVTVSLMADKAKRAAAVVTTDAQGRFRIAAPAAGTYTLNIVAVGRRPYTRVMRIEDGKTQNLGVIRTMDSSGALGTATVTAQRPIVTAEPDRIGYAIADDPEAKASMLTDMLRKVPMVTVDGEDNIQVNGSSNFKVYVNGKPNPMLSSNPSLIMKNMPASMVKKVEVITNPGAREDAEGVSGILNLVTEGEAKTTGYTLTPSVQMTTQGAIGSLYGLVKTGRLTLSGTYVLGRIFQPDYKRGTEREDFTAGTLLETYGTGHVQGTFHYASLEASYEFSDRDLLSLSGGWHGWRGSVYDFNTTGMYDVSADRRRVDGYDLFTGSRMRMLTYADTVAEQQSLAHHEEHARVHGQEG